LRRIGAKIYSIRLKGMAPLQIKQRPSSKRIPSGATLVNPLTSRFFLRCTHVAPATPLHESDIAASSLKNRPWPDSYVAIEG
jgi:hypothetical protein